MRKDKYGPESYGGIRLWAFLFFLLTVYFSLYEVRLPHTVTAGISYGIFAHAGAVLLYAVMLITGRIYWTGEITYQEAARAGESARRGFALKRLWIFLAGAAVCCVYACLRSGGVQGGSIQDSMVSAAVFCASVRGAARIPL